MALTLVAGAAALVVAAGCAFEGGEAALKGRIQSLEEQVETLTQRIDALEKETTTAGRRLTRLEKRRPRRPPMRRPAPKAEAKPAQ